MTMTIENEKWLRYVETLDFNPLFVTVSGAHIYGFPSPDSDVDLRGCHRLPLPKIVSLDPGNLTYDRSSFVDGIEVDIVSHDVGKYFAMLIKNNGYVLEQIFSPIVIKGDDFLRRLKPLAANCITKFHYHHYRGFYATQRRLIEKSHAKTSKSILYAYRVLMTGTHLLRSGKVVTNVLDLNNEFRLPFLQDLINSKLQEKSVDESLDWSFHASQLDRLEATMETAFANSSLPEDRDVKAVDQFLVDLRLDQR